MVIKENVKLLIWCLGTFRCFGDVLLEFQVFPGFSKAIWFGIPRSQEKLISRTPLPGTRREREREKNQHQNFVLDRAKNDDSTHDFCISSLKSEQIIDAIQEKQTRAV